MYMAMGLLVSLYVHMPIVDVGYYHFCELIILMIKQTYLYFKFYQYCVSRYLLF